MNEGLWERLVEGYYERIFSYCCHLLGSKTEAQDITHEVFVKAYTTHHKLRDVTKERAWIYTIARNCCFDRRRWWKRFLYSDKQPEVENIFSSELSYEIQEAVAQLPTKQREVFILRHWHQFSTEETAQLLHIHTGTVKSHLKRAVDSLKERLQ